MFFDRRSLLNIILSGMEDRDSAADTEQRNCWRTLEQVLHTWKSQDPNDQWIVTDEMLNALDLPLPRGQLEHMPRLR